jgi:hypothetical protein
MAFDNDTYDRGYGNERESRGGIMNCTWSNIGNSSEGK